MLGDLYATPFDPADESRLAALDEATIVTVQDNRAVANVLHAVVDSNVLRHTQEEVVASRRLPEY